MYSFFLMGLTKKIEIWYISQMRSLLDVSTSQVRREYITGCT
jgi:hypothetical protein